jgi:hypothetical protein
VSCGVLPQAAFTAFTASFSAAAYVSMSALVFVSVAQTSSALPSSG